MLLHLFGMFASYIHICLQADDNQMDVADSQYEFDSNVVEEDYVVTDMSDKENEHNNNNAKNKNMKAHRSRMITEYNLFN